MSGCTYQDEVRITNNKVLAKIVPYNFAHFDRA